MKLLISLHASQRFRERWRKGGEVKEIAILAFLEGRVPKRKILNLFTKLGFHFPNYWTATYRVYRDFLFIYQPKGDGVYSLQTLYPVNFVYKKMRQSFNASKKYTKKK